MKSVVAARLQIQDLLRFRKVRNRYEYENVHSEMSECGTNTGPDYVKAN